MAISQYTTGYDFTNQLMMISGLISVSSDYDHSTINVDGTRMVKFHALHGKKIGESRKHKNNWSLSIVGEDRKPRVRWFDDVGDIHQWLDLYKNRDITNDDANSQFVDR